MAKRNVHVVPHAHGWAVKKEHGERASVVTSTQKAAIAAGIQLAKSEHSELLVHRPNGRIRSKDSYGNDPLPPRDKEH